MARRARTTAADDVLDLPPNADASAAKLSSFFAELGGNPEQKVCIYEVDPKNRARRGFLFVLESSGGYDASMLMAQLLEKHGAGEYLAEVRDELGQLVNSARFVVGSLKPRALDIPGPLKSAPVSDAREDRLLAALERQGQLLEQLAAQLTTRPSVIDQLRELKEVRDLFAPAQPSQPFDVKSLLGVVTDVLNLRDKLGTVEGGNDNPLTAAIHALAPMLQGAIEKLGDAEKLRALARPALPVADTTAPMPTVSDEQQSEGTAVDTSSLMVSLYIKEALTLAERGVASKDAAARLLSTLAAFPDAIVQQVTDFLDDEAILAKLAAIDPRALAHGPWLEEVVDELLTAVYGPDDEPEKDGGPSAYSPLVEPTATPTAPAAGPPKSAAG